MIIKENDALERLNSPLNLINRLKSTSSRKGAMDLFGVGVAQTEDKTFYKPPVMTPSPELISTEVAIAVAEVKATPVIDDLLENADTKIKLAQVHDLALNTLHSAITTMSTKLDDIKPEKLSQVITAMGKTVNDIRKERNDALKNNSDKQVSIIFYTPEQRKVSDYAVIDV